MTTSGDGKASVLLGNGDGTFQAKRDFGTGGWPFSVVVTDFNSDGRSDLVTADQGSGTASVLLGNGNGTFQAKRDFGTGTNPSSVAVADFNSDGVKDLVTANYGLSGTGTTASVLLGNGDGTLQAKQDFGTGGGPSWIAVADFNSDGRSDLVTTNGDGKASVLLGNGNGTFQAKRDFGTGTNPSSVAVADLNSDGKSDLVTADMDSSTASVLLGNGNGTFKAKQSFGTGTHPQSVAVPDLNGDGKSDLVTADYSSNTTTMLLGNGDGTFQAKQSFGTGSTALTQLLWPTSTCMDPPVKSSRDAAEFLVGGGREGQRQRTCIRLLCGGRTFLRALVVFEHSQR